MRVSHAYDSIYSLEASVAERVETQFKVNHENTSWKPSVLNVISTANAVFCRLYQYNIHLTKLSCVGFCSSCTFDYCTEYFMRSRNGSVCFTFHTYDKITYAYISSEIKYVSYVRIELRLRTCCFSGEGEVLWGRRWYGWIGRC